jgi:hypothetical protein
MLARREGEMAFEELKQRQSAMWGSAPFEEVGPIADMPSELVSPAVVERVPERLHRRCEGGADASTGAHVQPILARPRAEPPDERVVVVDLEEEQRGPDGIVDRRAYLLVLGRRR